MLGFDDFLKIVLGSFRVGGLLLAMPLFGGSPVPPSLKIILAMSLSALMLPVFGNIPEQLWSNNGVLLFVVGREVGLGLMMGFMVRFIFLIMSMTLDFAGMQMGFSMAEIFDPANNAQISVVSQLGVVLTVLFFFAANLHHHIFLALAKSYELVPIGLPVWNSDFLSRQLVHFLSETFAVSVRLTMPVMAAMLTVHVIMGVLARTAPQMNLFFNVAFMLNVGIGLTLVITTLPQMLPEISKLDHALVLHGYGLW